MRHDCSDAAAASEQSLKIKKHHRQHVHSILRFFVLSMGNGILLKHLCSEGILGLVQCLDRLWNPLLQDFGSAIGAKGMMEAWDDLTVQSLLDFIEQQCTHIYRVSLPRLRNATSWILNNIARLWNERVQNRSKRGQASLLA